MQTSETHRHTSNLQQNSKRKKRKINNANMQDEFRQRIQKSRP